jgi:hypothetical protein
MSKKAMTYTHPVAQYACTLLNSMVATASAKELTGMLLHRSDQEQMVRAVFDLAEEFERVGHERGLMVHGEEGVEWSFVNGRYRRRPRAVKKEGDDAKPE